MFFIISMLKLSLKLNKKSIHSQKSEYTFETDRMSDGETRDSRSRIREKLFPGTTEYKDRENFLFDETVFVHQLQYAPSHLTALKVFIILFRDLLVSSYEKDEKMGAGPILPTDKDRMHLRILKLFHKTHSLGTPAQTIRRGPESMITECPLKRDTHDTRDDVQRPRKKKRYVFYKISIRKHTSTCH